GGCAVEPASDSPWLHVTGVTAGKVSFLTDPNPASVERHALITVSGKKAAPVTQAGSSGGGTVPHDEIVLDARNVASSFGAWQLVPDEVHGSMLAQPDAGPPKLTTAQAFPSNWFSFTFSADAGRPYHLWIHGRAQNDSWQNDSI